MIQWLIIITFCWAVFSALMFLTNLSGFRRTGSMQDASRRSLPPVSVLIPARNEASGIQKTLETTLSNKGVEFEVVVLDDHSEDSTADIVQAIADNDPRVRLVAGRELPNGWCGKQFACHQLAAAAHHEELLFLDADVRLTEDAICRATAHRQQTQAPLTSGFPRQITGTLGEGLLIPLIHVVLLTYLPFLLMRRTKMQSASAGCGQFFLTNRQDYERAGGHQAIRGSLHDGVTLPRAYRQARLATDLFDASDIAQCRMYKSWDQTWKGLLKNAHEGIANPRLIVPFTLMMGLGSLLPFVFLGLNLVRPMGSYPFFGVHFPVGYLILGSILASYLPRLLVAARFDRAWLAAALHPLSILLFLAVQWVALIRQQTGTRPPSWRGRVYPAAT